MKKIVRNLTALSCLGSSAFAAPFLALGDNAELFLTGVAGVRFDDNILLTERNERDDTIFTFTPGLELTFGKGSQLTGSASISELLSQYVDYDELNQQLFTGAFIANYEDGKTKIGVNASLTQLDQNTPDTIGTRTVAGIIRRDVKVFGATAEVGMTEKTSVGTGVTFENTDYIKDEGVDVANTTLPVNVYYELTPKVDLSTGFSYRISDFSGAGLDTETYYYNVGARGEFTPKLTGSFSVGYTESKAELSANDDEGFGMQAGLNYALTEKSTIGVNASNDFGASSAGATQKNSRIGLTFNTDIAADWKANAGLSYRMIDYVNSIPKREDDFYDATFGLTYVINAALSVNGSYSYRENDASVTGGSFTNNVWSLSITARY